MTAQSRLIRNLAVMVYLSLLICLLIPLLQTDPGTHAFWLKIPITLLPLLIFAPGLLQGRNRSYLWICFVVLVYFTAGVVQAWLTQGAILPVITTGLTILLFSLAIAFVRSNRFATQQVISDKPPVPDL